MSCQDNLGLHLNFKFNRSIDATGESGRYGRLLNHSLKKPNCVTKVKITYQLLDFIVFSGGDVGQHTAPDTGGQARH